MTYTFRAYVCGCGRPRRLENSAVEVDVHISYPQIFNRSYTFIPLARLAPVDTPAHLTVCRTCRGHLRMHLEIPPYEIYEVKQYKDTSREVSIIFS